MEVADIAEFARNFAVMVRVHGPDPKALKTRTHAFHLHQSGETTLSASGLLLPPSSLTPPPPIIDHIRTAHRHSGAVVVTAASVVEPFLVAHQRNSHSQEFSPKLIAGASVDVLRESGSCGGGSETEPQWLHSRLLALVDVSASSLALLSLVGDHASWDVGWSLPPLPNAPQSKMGFQRQGNDNNSPHGEADNLILRAKLATRIAFLGVSTDIKDVLHLSISHPQKKGDLVLVMGSPFGTLSPLHFFNSISVGTVANCCPPTSYNTSLLMADIRCLPGMEGGPVFDSKARLGGVLTRPLRQKGSSAEIQLVVTWDAIVNTWSNDLKKDARTPRGELVDMNDSSVQSESLQRNNSGRLSVNYLPTSSDLCNTSQSPLEKAISSVVLVTVGDGVWASGIVLNNHGLVLTNAHILEPREFGRTSIVGQTQKPHSVYNDHCTPFHQREGNGKREREVVYSEQFRLLNDSVETTHEPSSIDLSYKNYKKISIRMDHVKPSIWCDARVIYVSKGPLDVALLQLESISSKLCPINPEFLSPLKGSSVHVIGHGLVGPRSDLQPSVSSGVLANAIMMPRPLHLHESSILDQDQRFRPIMLQTTASVHPGASGGALVNSDGCMIGLITSNVRHGGGAIIPHMNFSIPSLALEPIFKFSEKQDLSILQVLDQPDEYLSSVWALSPPSPPKFHDSYSQKNENEIGSRFSKFLSEKHTDFTQLVDRGVVIRDKLSSKM